MRLVGLNAGRVRPQLIDGEVVQTAYVKAPVPEPWLLTASGVEGDQVAVHTDHLYVFDRDGYAYWAEQLGVPPASWGDGHFAENLTVDVLDPAELRVGDRFRLGTAVVVVTGPRVPCWKLTWRLGQPKSFMRRFRLSGRSGSYFGVFQPGVVHPGDEFVLIGREAGAPTVAELSRLCDSSTRITPAEQEVIDAALRSPHLSDTVRSTLTVKTANLARDADTVDGWRGWRRFEVDEAVPETADTTSFLLRPADHGPLPRFRAGQHVVVRLTTPGAEPVVRTWSLSGYAADPDHYRITVKLRPSGRGSAALSRPDGLVVELRTPAGRFALDRGSFRPVVLVAAGIGITPMIAMVRAHLDRNGFVPPLWVLYGTPDEQSTAFRAQLDALAAEHEDLQLHYFHSRTAADGEPAGRPGVHRGRITAERVVALLRGNYLPTADGPAGIPWFESDIYLCGSVEFTDSVRSGLLAAGANPEHVAAEDFAAAAADPGGPRRHRDATVGFGSRGVVADWSAVREQTLLELAENSGLALPYDCRVGTCRTCEARLLSGEVDGPVADAPDGRRVLLCTSYPLSDHVDVEPPDD